MPKSLEYILDWSEVWAPLIPLGVLFFHTKQPNGLKPVTVYLWLALFINILSDLNVQFKEYFPLWFQSNNPLYNIHSVVRFTCFSWFFIMRKKPYFAIAKKIIPVLFAIFLIINFTFFQDFFLYEHLSGSLFSTEAFLLLVYCLLYYLRQLKEDTEDFTGSPDFWIVTGLSIYVVINFFVFLFYVPLLNENSALANNMWNVHNVAYILFCLFIAKAFYVSDRNK